MKFALIMSMGLFIASCNAAESSKEGEAGHIVMIPGQTLATKLENVSAFLKLGACDNAASLYDRELAPADLAPGTRVKLLTMIAGKYFEQDRDVQGQRYAQLAAQAHAPRIAADDDLRDAVSIAATSVLRMFDLQENRRSAAASKD